MKLERNNNRRVIYRLAFSNLSGKKIYSLFTLITIFLSVTFVSTLILFLLGKQWAEKKNVDNMQQVMFMNVSQEQMNSLSADKRTELLVPYKYNDIKYEAGNLEYRFCYLESRSDKIRTYIPAEGAAPEKYREIAADKKFFKAMGVEAEAGALVSLDVNGETIEFIISGYTDNSIDMSVYPIYVSREFAEKSPVMKDISYSALVRVKDGTEMTVTEFETIVYQMASEYGIDRMDVNMNGKFEDSIRENRSILYSMIVIAILIFSAGAIVIYSIFYLSVTSRTQQIGQLLTIGMTQKQMKSMVRKEGLLLSAFSVPLALIISGIFAYILQPDGWDFVNYGSTSVIIGIATICIVQASIRTPASIAAKLSPIEAAGCFGDEGKSKETNGVHKRLTALRLALMAAGRDWKKWRLTTISLALGGIIFMAAASVLASWNEDNYSRQGIFRTAEIDISYLYDAHSSPQPYGSTDLQMRGQLDSNLRQRILNIPHVKGVEVKHSAFGILEYQGTSFGTAFSPLTQDNIEYLSREKGEGSSYDFLAEQDAILITSYELSERIYGVSFQPGDKLTLRWFDGQEHSMDLEIGGLISGDIEKDIDSSYFMANQTFEKIWKNMNTAGSFRVSVEDYENNGEQVEQDIRTILSEYSDLRISTLHQKKIDDSAAIQRINTQIYGICGFIILFSVLNLINILISSITTRKKELSMLESIGMQEKQICSMLLWEGFFLILPNILITVAAGTAAGYGIVAFWDSKFEYMDYGFPYLGVSLYISGILVISLLTVILCFRLQNKDALVERIKYLD